MPNDYQKQTARKRTEDLRKLERELPRCCLDYFIAIESQTGTLTRLAYAYDLRTFFQYLSAEVRTFDGKEILSFDDDDLRRITKGDIVKTSLRSYFLQNGFNYGNYQGLGYANMLYPTLRKMYKDDDDALQAALKDNIEFFNSNIHFTPFITSLHLVMLQNKTPGAEIRNIKMALMGPLAGIGDSLSQFCLAPLFGTIGASLAADGLMLGPLFFWLGMNITLLIIKLLTGNLGYKLGTSVISTLSEKMAQISNVASMIGVAVISGLAVNFVKINCALQYVSTMPTGEQSVVSIQSMMDAIAPKLLPVLYTALMFYLIKKKKWTTYKLVILTIIVGVLLSVLGILA